MQTLFHAFEHAIIDSLKMLPFLVIAFAVLEILESSLEEKSSLAIEKSGKAGPFTGALLGLVPQCGFSVIGSNLYAKRVITLGTILAVYLSTSDEALIVMLTSPNRILDVLLIMGLKFVIAFVAGYLIDLFVGKKPLEEDCHHCHHHDDSCEDEELVGEEHCCSHTDWKQITKCTVKRTISVWLFIVAVSFVFGYGVELVGEDRLYEIMLTDSIFQPLITALVGLIPNCAPSVILAQMYINGAISLGSVVSGLCTSAGVGLMVLFHVNRGLKSNLAVLGVLYGIGAFSGMAIQLVCSLL